MKQNIVLIVCLDKEYTSSVEYDLASVLRKEYALETIDDKNYLEEYLKSPHRIDTLIIDEELAGDFCQKQIPAHVYQLSEGDESTGKINKYTGAHGIVQALGPNYLLEESDDKGSLSHLINVISVSGGAGKTATALGTAYWLSRKGYKTLYIDAEDFQTFDQILGCDPGDDKTDRNFASVIKDSSEEKILSLVKNDLVSYMKPFHGILASYGLSARDYHVIADKLRETNDFDYVILEHRSGIIDSDTMRLILEGDRLIIVSEQTGHAAKRTLRLLENIGEYSGQSVIVCGRYKKDRPDKLSELVSEEDYPIAEYIPELEDVITMKEIYSHNLLKDTAEAIV